MTGVPADPNWVRDKTGYDMTKFIWSGRPPVEGGPRSLTSFVTPDPLTGNVNDWNPTTNQTEMTAFSVVRASSTVPCDITGIVPGVGGEIKSILNVGTEIITLKDQDSGSQVQNRFALGDDMQLTPGGMIEIWYDPIDLDWKLYGGSATALVGVTLSGIEFVADGAGVPLTTGLKAFVEIPFNCTVTSNRMFADEVGSLVIDVWRCTYAQFDAGATHPVFADRITDSTPPTIAVASKSEDTTLAGWSTTLNKGDVIGFNITSCVAIKRATLSLDVTRGSATNATNTANFFATRSDAASTSIPATTEWIRTQGFAVLGDNGDALYERFATNPGTDGAFQSADGAYWELKEPYHAEAFGVVAGTTNNQVAAINEAISRVNALGGGTLILPTGNIRVGTTRILLLENVRLRGAVEGGTVLQLGADFVGELIIYCFFQDNCSVTDLGIDGNGFNFGGAIFFQGCDNIAVERCTLTKVYEFGVTLQGVTRFRVADNSISRTAASTTSNEGIIATDAIQNSYGEVIRNRLIKTGMDISAEFTTIGWNHITDWGYGGGITTEQSAKCHDLVITGNICSGGGPAPDIVGTHIPGIENWAKDSIVSNNICFENGGPGVDQGGSNCTITGNICYDNSQETNNTYDGIVARYDGVTYNSNNTIYVSNQSYNTGGTGQRYGYSEQSALLVGIVLGPNILRTNATGEMLVLSTDTRVDGVANGRPVTYANRPTVPREGMTAVFTDSMTNAWGDIVAGGGVNRVLAYYNNVNWTVIGK